MAGRRPRQYIFRIGDGQPPAAAGNKAHNLHRLIQNGIRVPRTHVVVWEAYDDNAQVPSQIVAALRPQLATALDLAKSYAVRSSANIEDSPQHSFAGQFDSVLDVHGEEALIEAIRSVWAATQSAGARAYLQQRLPETPMLRMAVILQEMVEPEVSGVAFSRNPISGEAEVIVEAVEGPGTALVQHGVTPWRWVHREGGWKVSSAEGPISTALIADVVAGTRQIAGMFQMDVDLEWVFDGQDLYWVQMREIGGLETLPIFSNRIAREVLPGMIKPLVWSVNVPLVNSAWIELLTEVIGKNDLTFDDLARSFYFRAYFNLSALGRVWAIIGLPQESLEMLMGIQPRAEDQRLFRPTWRMMRLAPRLVRFLWNKWRLGRRFEQDYPRLLEKVATYDWREASGHSETELLDRIDALYADLHRPAYYNINVPLMMALYNAMFDRFLYRAGVDPARFDMMAGMTEYQDYAPDHFLQALHRAFARLDPALREAVRGASYSEFLQIPGIASFQDQVAAFLERFGHLSDSGNDFSVTPWRERPELVLQLIAVEAESVKPPAEMVRFSDLALARPVRPLARLVHDRARQFRLYREQISSLYTYAYGLFRPYCLALAERLTARGVIAEPDDIFFLTRAEIEAIVSDGAMAKPPEQPAALAVARKAEMERSRNVRLPSLIYGNEAPLLGTDEAKLRGVATSRGTYTGPVRVVRGLEDFDRLQPGDVLVIPYSDVGWTPLFARAGAVIAESGGMLSHSSIVAREYQIPAVVSVPAAMHLVDGTLVTVDGYRGEVFVHSDGETPSSPAKHVAVTAADPPDRVSQRGG